MQRAQHLIEKLNVQPHFWPKVAFETMQKRHREEAAKRIAQTKKRAAPKKVLAENQPSPTKKNKKEVDKKPPARPKRRTAKKSSPKTTDSSSAATNSEKSSRASKRTVRATREEKPIKIAAPTKRRVKAIPLAAPSRLTKISFYPEVNPDKVRSASSQYEDDCMDALTSNDACQGVRFLSFLLQVRCQAPQTTWMQEFAMILLHGPRTTNHRIFADPYRMSMYDKCFQFLCQQGYGRQLADSLDQNEFADSVFGQMMHAYYKSH